MIAVAASLRAKVQGDDGEEYNEIEPVQPKAKEEILVAELL